MPKRSQKNMAEYGSAMKRNDPRMMVARLVQCMLTYVPFMLVQGSIARLLPGWMMLPWTMLVLYYTLTRVSYVCADWMITKWEAGLKGLIIHSGFLKKTRISVSWAEVGTLDVRQGWINRVLRVHSVSAIVGAGGHSCLVLEALTHSDVLRLTNLQSRWSAHAADRGEQDGGVAIYRSRLREFIPIGFAHGQFLLVVPFLFGAGGDLMELFGFNVLATLRSVDGQGVVLFFLAAGFFALFFGTLQAALKYYSYTVRQYAWGYSVSGGLFEKSRRDARLGNIVGVRVERNPLMVLTGTCSLHLILATGRSDSKSLPLFPLISWRDVDHHIEQLLPSSKIDQVTRRTFLEPCLVLLATMVVAIAAWQLLGHWVAGLVMVFGLMSANVLCVKLGRNGSTVWIDTGMFARQMRIIDIGAVRETSYITWVGPRRWLHGWLGLKVLDQRIRVHWIPRVHEVLASSFAR